MNDKRKAQVLSELLDTDDPATAGRARMRLAIAGLDPHADKVFESRCRKSNRALINFLDADAGSEAWHLGMAFLWREAPEGYDYWRGLCGNLPGVTSESLRNKARYWVPWSEWQKRKQTISRPGGARS